jgi:hypothetical protein
MKDEDFCTKLTANCLTTDEGTEKSNLGGFISGYLKPCCLNAIKETCFYTMNLFKENNLKYWLDFGTLLGAVRNGEIIPWDKDADFGILKKDENILLNLERKINEDGFYFKVHLPGIYRIHYSKTNLNFVDIFTWDLHTPDNIITGPVRINPKPDIIFRNGFLYGVAGVLNHVYKSFPYYFVEKTVPLNFYDEIAQVPQDYEKFLELRFGTGWKIPKRGWVRKNVITSPEIEDWCLRERNWSYRV